MIVVPVLDVSNGCCVRAVAGKRSAYQALTSPLVDGHGPREVGAALLEELSPSALYVADLDGIVADRIQWDLLTATASWGEVWLDAGTRRSNIELLLQRMSPLTQLRCVLATETLDDLQVVPMALSALDGDRVMVSLDLHAGRPITACAQHSAYDVTQLASAYLDLGVRQFIVLDTAAVGGRDGCPTWRLIQDLKALDPSVFVATGGGIRGSEDLGKLADAGCDAALVSSAIHDGHIAPEHMVWE